MSALPAYVSQDVARHGGKIPEDRYNSDEFEYDVKRTIKPLNHLDVLNLCKDFQALIQQEAPKRRHIIDGAGIESKT